MTDADLAAARDHLTQALALLTPDAAPRSFYTSISDRLARPKPTLPTLGPAGFRFTDPTFGSPMLRVTDPTTHGGQACCVPSNATLSAWNGDSTRFYVLGAGGEAIFFGFDGKTATLLLDNDGRWPAHIGSYIEPCFSYVDPALIYGAAGASNRVIQRYNLLTGTVTNLLDLDVLYASRALPVGYVGGLVVTDHDVFVTLFGGAQQDQHTLIHHSIAGLFDSAPLGWKIHGLAIDRTGRYVLIGPTAGDIAKGVAQLQIWDTVTQIVTPVTTLPGGHACSGYGVLVNADCCTASTYDAAQWQFRGLATPAITRDVISPVLQPKEVFLSEHSNWRAAKPDVSVPFISSTFRYGTNPLSTWRPWDDEVIAVDPISGTVNRFAHHRSAVDTDFWSQPIVNVDPTGRFALVTSNWEHTVGAGRQDVFLVTLR